MLIVSDYYYREYTQDWVVEVLPVTEHGVPAADWTYVVPAGSSGWGEPLSVHVDFQFTCTRSDLVRRLARLEEPCRTEIHAAYQQYSTGLEAPIAPVCGEFGSLWERRSSDWKRFEEEAYVLVRDAALPLPADDPTKQPCFPLEAVPTQVGQWPLSPVPVLRHQIQGSYEAPTTPFSLRGSRSFDACTIPNQGLYFGETPNDPGPDCSILELIEVLQSRTQAKTYTPQTYLGSLETTEDLSYLRDVRRLSGTPDGREVMSHIKRVIGRAPRLSTVRLIVEAHSAAESPTQPKLLQRAARRASPGDSHS